MSEFIEILDCKSSRVILNTRDIVRVGEHRDGCAITVIFGGSGGVIALLALGRVRQLGSGNLV